MALFKFRFATLLRLREHAKEETQWQLRALLQSQRRLEEEIAALDAAIRDAGVTLAGAAGQVFDAADLKLFSEYAQLADRRQRLKRADLAALGEQIAAKRDELVEAMRAVKSLEQLRQRQRARFDREQDVIEQKFTDEIARRKFYFPPARKKNPL